MIASRAGDVDVVFDWCLTVSRRGEPLDLGRHGQHPRYECLCSDWTPLRCDMHTGCILLDTVDKRDWHSAEDVMFFDATGDSRWMLCLALLLVVGCESSDDRQPESVASQQFQQQASEHPDEGAAAVPPVDGESDDASPAPRFEISSNPHREELHRPKIEAVETTELTLHENPDDSSKIVDRLEVHSDEEIEITGDSKMLIFTDLKKLPEAMTVSTFAVPANADDAEEIELQEGELVSYFLEYGGEGTYIGHLWYRDQTRRIEVTEPLNELFDTGPQAERSGFDFDRDQWWIQTEGPGTDGWLLVNVDELTTSAVMLEGYR